MEEELVRWLRHMGYKPHDSTLSRSSAARLIKGSNRPVWEFLIERVRPAAEADTIREDAQAARQGGFKDAKDVQEAKRRASLRLQRQRQQEQNRELQEMLSRQTVSSALPCCSTCCAVAVYLQGDR